VLIAEANAAGFTSGEFAAWGMIAFALAGGVNQVLKLMDRFRGSPSGAEAAAEARARYVTRDELDDRLRDITSDIEEQSKALKAETQLILSKIEHVKGELNEASERRIISVHERLNEISAVAIRAEDRTRSHHS
jgi:hypothetical protein